jgi:hypothetical protein
MMLFLSRLDPLVLEFPPFMIDVYEVVDSLAESSKYVCTRIRQEPEASVQNRKNRTLRFGKLALDEGASPLAKRRLDR